MKKLMVVLVIATLGFMPGNAQDIKIGAKAGVNLASIGGDFPNAKTRTAFHLGGMVEIPVLDHFSVQPELLYSVMGAKSDLNKDDILKHDYLTVPIMAKYYVTEEISIEGGPQLGLLLSAKFTEDGQTDDVKDITKATDVGFNIGAGYKMENGIQLGVRYYFGTDVNTATDGSGKITNNVFQISVGYFFY